MRDWEAFVREQLDLPEMRGHQEERITSELAAHLEDVFDDALRRGVTEEEAEALVLRELEDREAATRELIRSEPTHLRASAGRWAEGSEERIRRRGGGWASLADRIQEVRVAIRSLGRRPAFTAAVILVLALGIAANTAIFSLVQAVILDPLPFPEAHRLVGVWHTAPGRDIERVGHPHISYLHYRSENRVFQEMGAYRLAGFSLTGGESPERLGGAVVTPSVFRVLGVNPVEGRTFLEEEGRSDAALVVVLSHPLWSRRFGGDPDIVGKTITVDGRPHTVVGVMPAEFEFPTGDARLWIPMRIDEANPDMSYWSQTGIARLGPGVDRTEAESELNRLVSTLPERYPDPEPVRAVLEEMGLNIRLTSYKSDAVRSVSSTLWILLGSVGILLLIACANVANLYLVRAEGRQHEVAVRTALGASRGTIARVFLTESTLLAMVGGCSGLLLAYLATPAILAMAPGGIPRLSNVGIDLPVLLFTCGVTLLSGIFFGMAPLLRRLPTPAAALHQGGTRATSGRIRRRARSFLAVAQITLALVLMAGSGLMVRSFLHLQGLDRGFEAENVLTLRLSLSASQYPSPAETAPFYDQLLDRVRGIPGVVEAGAGMGLPYSNRGTFLGHTMEDFPLEEDEFVPNYSTQHVYPGYFEALGIPLLAGRLFDWTDVRDSTLAVVISAPLAERYWPDQDPIGRRLTPAQASEGNPWYEIVGVVGAVRYEGLTEPPTEVIYYPHKPLHFSADALPIFPPGLGLVVRTAVAPESLTRAVSEAVWSVDPNIPVTGVRSMEEVVVRAGAQTAFSMLLLMVAAGMALILGVVGLYGVLSYLVSQRTHEFGIRMALGASRDTVISMVLRGGVTIASTGIVLGLAGSLALTRLLRSFLFGVSPSDPLTLGSVSALLLAVSAAATLLPARRAARVDPLQAMRSE